MRPTLPADPADAAPHALTETVADTLMALMLTTARRVVEVAERVKAGEWTKALVRTGSVWMFTAKRWALSVWGVSGWRWRSARAGFMPILYNARRHHSEAEEQLQRPLLRAGYPAAGSRFCLPGFCR